MMESCSLMWYNQEMTDKAGIKPPTEIAQSWTMEQALEAWQKVNNPPNVYGIRWGQGNTTGQDYENGLFRRAAGSSKESRPKAVADDGVTISAISIIRRRSRAISSWPTCTTSIRSPRGIPEAFFNQRAAFFVAPDNTIGIYNRLHPNGSFKYSVTGIPYFKGGTQICHTDSWHWALGANSQNKAEAAQFIKFLSGPVGSKIVYETIRQLPAHVDLLNTLPEYQQMPRALVAQQFKAAGAPRVQLPGFTEYNGLAIEFFQNIIQGSSADVQRLATDVAKRADGLMAKYKDWKTK
jgi:ABC-type glycerol-3-phosphate transport system substrate-binding protein